MRLSSLAGLALLAVARVSRAVAASLAPEARARVFPEDYQLAR